MVLGQLQEFDMIFELKKKNFFFPWFPLNGKHFVRSFVFEKLSQEIFDFRASDTETHTMSDDTWGLIVRLPMSDPRSNKTNTENPKH